MAELPKGTGITGYLSLGVLTEIFSLSQVKTMLISEGQACQRQRDLPVARFWNSVD